MKTSWTRVSWIKENTCQDLKYKTLHDCENQLGAGLGIALNVSETAICKSVLVFGVGGNGKSSFPALMGHEMFARHGVCFRFIEVSCDEIPLEEREPEKLREIFKGLLTDLTATKDPKIVVFDEMDGIVPPAYEVNPRWRALIYFLRAFLRKQPTNTLVIGVTNNPKQMEHTVTRIFYLPIYFPPTSRATALKMFDEKLKRPEWSRICVEYLDKMASLGYNPQGFTISRVIDDFAAQLDKDASKWTGNIDIPSIVKGLIAHSGIPLTTEEIAAYRERNGDLIEASLENCIPWWCEYYDGKCKKTKGESVEFTPEITIKGQEKL